MALPAVLVEQLRRAKDITVFTGAGMSAESGIPTFRDKQTGLWQRFNAEDLATPAAFARDPTLVWGWYEWRRMKVLRAQPNAGHLAIAHMAAYARVHVITQNVDDLHERAGSKNVVHLHGRLMHPYCQGCKQPHLLQGVPNEPEGGRRIDPPTCLHCGDRIRPGVVWFGESLPTNAWEQAQWHAQHCDVFFCIGTSSLVQPAASLTALAGRAGVVTVQINPHDTALQSQVSANIRAPAGVVLPELLNAAWDRD